MTLPRKIGRYEPSDDILFVDATGLVLDTPETVSAVFDELDALARAYPGRHALVCWQDVSIANQTVASEYGTRAARWGAMLAGVARYGAVDPVVRSYIRTEALKHQKDGMRSNLYETREAALAAIRAMRDATRK